MTDNRPEMDVMFYQLVLSMQASIMQHLGKVMSPISGEVERNMEAAKYSIDILDMLKRKTDGNLIEDEAKMLDHVLYQLRMNYVEEVNKGEGDAAEKTDEPSSTEPGDAPATPASDEEPSATESDDGSKPSEEES